MAVIDGAVNDGGVEHLLLLPTYYYAQRAWSRVDGVEPLGHGDQPHLHTIAPCTHYTNRDTSRATTYVTTASATG
jgi:hypothetical protein